jgi:hypothetical protein
MPAERLTPAECAELGTLASALDCSRVRVYRERVDGVSGMLRDLVLLLSRNRPVALGNHVFLPSRCEHDLPVLAHEVTHCGQYQAWGPLRYFARGAAAQIRDLLHRGGRIGSSPYRYEADPIKPFESYGMEQQGQIVEDCFRGHPTARAISPFRPGGGNLEDHVIPSA